ncbi:MAG: winged helix-turn-helix domain-containing protein [Trichodesmium sp. St17_bin3_1_1]|nr:winged helix-turn-helix domain-containing protein [Trichodesmium sp. St17_bin3_1_1]
MLLCELCQYLKSKTGVKISISTMYRTLKKLNISRKKSICASQQEREDVKEKGYKYRKWLDLIDIDNKCIC